MFVTLSVGASTRRHWPSLDEAATTECGQDASTTYLTTEEELSTALKCQTCLKASGDPQTYEEFVQTQTYLRAAASERMRKTSQTLWDVDLQSRFRQTILEDGSVDNAVLVRKGLLWDAANAGNATTPTLKRLRDILTTVKADARATADFYDAEWANGPEECPVPAMRLMLTYAQVLPDTAQHIRDFYAKWGGGQSEHVASVFEHTLSEYGTYTLLYRATPEGDQTEAEVTFGFGNGRTQYSESLENVLQWLSVNCWYQGGPSEDTTEEDASSDWGQDQGL